MFKWFKKKDKEKKEEIGSYSHVTQSDYDALTDLEKARIANYSVFKLTKLETLRYSRFCDDHRKCGEGIHSSIGGLGPIVSFVGTGIGSIIHCKCQICGKEVDITDVDYW